MSAARYPECTLSTRPATLLVLIALLAAACSGGGAAGTGGGGADDAGTDAGSDPDAHPDAGDDGTDDDGDGFTNVEEAACGADPADPRHTCYACGWSRGDPGDLVATGGQVGDTVENLVLVDACSEEVPLWDLAGPYRILWMTTAW